MKITAQIDFWGEGVATFAPDKVIDRLEQWFPTVIIDPKDYSQDEVDQITNFVQQAEPEKRAYMIEQIKRKNRHNGPTYRFTFESQTGQMIEGYARRYSVYFMSEEEIDDATQNKIVEFLESLKLGEIVFG
jgi:hypothetical protein